MIYRKTAHLIVCLILIGGVSIFAQETLKETRGKELILLAKNAIRDTNITNYNGYSFKMTMRSDSQSVVQTFKTLDTDKLYYTFSILPTNTMISIWNGAKYSQDLIMILNGRTFSNKQLSKQIEGKPGAPKNPFESKSQSRIKSEFRTNMWYYVFPLTLDSSFDPDGKFTYVGKAESANGKLANVIDVDSNTPEKLRIFLDSETNQLLMAHQSQTIDETVVTGVYYYSRFSEQDGLKIPNDIVYQIESRSLDGKLISRTEKEYGSIEDFEVNPNYPKDLFLTD